MDDIGTLSAEKEGPEMIQAHGEAIDSRLEIPFPLCDFYIILVMLFMRIWCASRQCVLVDDFLYSRHLFT